MKITVKLYASLAKYAPDGEKDDIALDVAPMSIKELINHLGIPENDAGMVLINGKNAKYSDELSENDYIQILTELKGG